MAKLGYVGLGFMGVPMTHRLLQAGHEVAIWGRTPEKLKPVETAGAMTVSSAAEVARAAEIVFTCVSDTEAVRDVLFSPGGLAEGASPGKVLVDFSSIRPDAAREFAARLREETGMGMIDAPVSGGTAGAESGTLAVMAGGSEQDFETVRPIVEECVAAQFTLMGPNGAGQATKLINQCFVGGLFLMLAEAARLALNAGIDARRIPEALKGGRADSRMLQEFFVTMLDGEFPASSHIKTMLKDMNAVMTLAQETTSPMPLTAATTELFRLMAAHGHGTEDPTAVFKLYGKDPLPW